MMGKIGLFFDGCMIFSGIAGIVAWLSYDPATDLVIPMKGLGIVSLLLLVILYLFCNYMVDK